MRMTTKSSESLNRKKSIQSGAGILPATSSVYAPSRGVPSRIEFEYDWQGRRIRPKVWNDRDDGQGSKVSDTQTEPVRRKDIPTAWCWTW